MNVPILKKMFKTRYLRHNVSLFEKIPKLVIGIEYDRLFFSSNLISFFFTLNFIDEYSDFKFKLGFRIEYCSLFIYYGFSHIQIRYKKRN